MNNPSLRLFIVCVCLLQAACSNIKASSTVVLADTFKEVLGTGGRAVLPASMPTQYAYLKVEVEGRNPALFVLGYVDPGPRGDIEVWYSSEHEVLRLQNGRIIGTAGLELDWRGVSYPRAPSGWSELVPALEKPGAVAASYVRQRDVMPGYFSGIADEVTQSLGQPPAHVQSGNEFPVLRWVREHAESTPSIANAPHTRLPDAWFGIDPQSAMQLKSSYQCLSSQLCLRLQRWFPPTVR